MSQAGSYFDGTINGDVETLTADSGGPVGADASFNINVLGGNHITTVGNPGTNSITIDLDGDIAETYVTDSGSATPAAGILNVLGGDNMNTAGAGDTVTIHLNETIHWPNTNAAGTTGVIFLGGAGGAGGQRFMHNFGNDNTFLGADAGNFTLTVGSADENVGIGDATLISLTTGEKNTALGVSACRDNTAGNANTALGRAALAFNVSGSFNLAVGRATALNCTSSNNAIVGSLAGTALTSGTENTFIGTAAGGTGAIATPLGVTTGNGNIIIGSGLTTFDPPGTNYRSSESENILIANSGVVGESNTIRIGGAFGNDPTQNRCFIRGIYGVNPSGSNEQATVIDSSGQLGTIAQTNGQVLIGSTGATPVAATLTPGTGIGITNGAGSIAIASTGGGLTWNEVTGTSANMLVNNGYIANNAGLVTLTLPATAAQGSIIRVSVKGTGLSRVAQNAGQTIHFGNSDSTTGIAGFIEATGQWDAVELLCVTANTDFAVLSSIGNWTVS